MSDQRGKVLSFGPFELSIGNRLPDTTRSYALEKLAASGEHNSTAALYTSHLNKTLENNRGSPLDLGFGRSLPDPTTMAKSSGRVKA